MDSGIMLIIFFGIMLVTLFNGTPVFTSLGFAAVAGCLLWIGAKQLPQFGVIAYTTATNYNMIILPMFIMMSEFLSRGGIAEDIYVVLNRSVGKFTGGLAIATALACTVFAALCGSSPATAATIGRIAIKEMIKRKYNPSFAVGTVAAGGTLGIMLPPSVTFCIYALLTENSIVRLFMAGIIPGLMISGLIVISIIIRVRLNPKLLDYTGKDIESIKSGMEMTLSEAKEIVSTAKDQTKKELGIKQEIEKPANAVEGKKREATIFTILPALALILVILCSMYFGFATPFEAAGYGVIGAFVITILQRRLSKFIFKEAMLNASRVGAMMIFLVICGMSMTFVVSYLGIPQEISSTLAASGMGKYQILILLYVLWLILGAILEPTSMVLLTIPFLYSTMMQLGFDPIWLGVAVVLASEIAMITPPVGLNLFVLKASTNIPLNKIIIGSLPYVVVLLIALVLLTIFPGIATFLPSMMF